MPEASRLKRLAAWLARRFGMAGAVVGFVIVAIRLLFDRK